MRSEDNKEGQRDTFQHFSVEVSRDRVETLWRQAMAQTNIPCLYSGLTPRD